MKHGQKILLVGAIILAAATFWIGSSLKVQAEQTMTRALVVWSWGDSILVSTDGTESTLTSVGLKDVPLSDRDGKVIAVSELHAGDYVRIRTNDYMLATYPQQYGRVYSVRKTGEQDTALAERNYAKYKAVFSGVSGS